MRKLLAIGLAIASTNAKAETWHCRNTDFEITCTETGCHVQQEVNFTPMEILFNGEGELIVCAYSGCWEGEGDVTRSEQFLAVFAPNLIYSTDPEPGSMRQDIAILVDLKDNIALLRSGQFAQPFACTLQATKKERAE